MLGVTSFVSANKFYLNVENNMYKIKIEKIRHENIEDAEYIDWETAMDVREKLVELIGSTEYGNGSLVGNNFQKGFIEKIATHLIANGVTVQEYGEWVHPKECVVSNDFLCSKCGHREVSYYPINPRPGGGCIADENGNFYYPPKLNYCPNCGVKMDGCAD